MTEINPTPVDYLLIGHVTADLLPGGERVPGGTVSYAVRTAHAFGFKVGLVTSTVPDEPLLSALTPYADVISLPADDTTTYENIYTPQGRVQYLRGVASEIYARDIPEAWRSAPMVHLAPIAGEANHAELLTAFPDSALILATLQGWLRRRDENDLVHFKRWYDPEMLKSIDIVVFSQEDIRESPSMEQDIAGDARHLILTQDEKGGVHYDHGTQSRYDTPKVEVVNQTGAGDVFATSLLCSYHILNDFDKALTIAAHLGADCVTRDGLENSTPTREQVLHLLEKFGGK